jgi:hypothetical protein
MTNEKKFIKSIMKLFSLKREIKLMNTTNIQ